MHVPTMKGVIQRRLLINFRAVPEVVAALLPAPFRPQLYAGHAIVGICLIRLTKMRPSGAPPFIGLSSENAAHRIAVEWTDRLGELRQGVFVPRRDTSSWINSSVGGRLFPGEQHRAEFRVVEEDGRIDLAMKSRDGQVSLRVLASESDLLPANSCFGSLEESSRFFEGGSAGYSVTRNSAFYDGLKLITSDWCVRPLSVEVVESSYFASLDRFPDGSIEFDHGLIMTNVPHSWRAIPAIGSSLVCCLPGGR